MSSVSDLCTGLLDALVKATERSLGYYGHSKLIELWLADQFTCKLLRVLGNSSGVASNFILAVTSFDRALVVAKPMTTVKRGSYTEITLSNRRHDCLYSVSALE